MTELEMAERVGELRTLAARLRVPDHRFTAEAFLIVCDELQTALRRLDRDLGGRGRRQLPVPAAIERHRQRCRPAV